MQDKNQRSYANTPLDGSASEGAANFFNFRVMRGGAYYHNDAEDLRADSRGFDNADNQYIGTGFRLARLSR